MAIVAEWKSKTTPAIIRVDDSCISQTVEEVTKNLEDWANKSSLCKNGAFTVTFKRKDETA